MFRKYFKYIFAFFIVFLFPLITFAETDPCSMQGESIKEISCNTIFTPEAVDIIKEVLGYFRILGPLVLIAMLSVDYVRVVIGQDADELKKATGRAVKRIIAAICLFLVPTFVVILLDLPGMEAIVAGRSDPLCYDKAVGTAANNAVANTSKCAYKKAKDSGWVPPSPTNPDDSPTPPASDSAKCDGTSYYGSAHVADNSAKYDGGGKTGVTMLKCAAKEVEKAFNIISKYCGTIKHSGAMRSLSAEVTQSRSKTSFHYTGRAIDLSVSQGMSSKTTYFYVTLDNTTGRDNAHYYRLYCLANKSNEPSQYVSNRTIVPVEGRAMRKKSPVTANFLDVTAVMNAYGFTGIGPRSCYKTDSMCLEWWHFQNSTGLKKGSSTFGDALRQYYKPSQSYPSGIRSCFNAKFSGLGFSC